MSLADTLAEQIAAHVAGAREAVAKAQAESRSLTKEERGAVDYHVREASRLKKDIENVQAVDDELAGIQKGLSGSGGDLYGLFKKAGFPGAPRATIDGSHLSKSPTFTGTVEELAPTRREGAALGADERFIANAFPVTNIGNATAIQVMYQTGRGLAAGSPSVSRGLLDVTPKAEVDTGRALLTEEVGQLAVTEPGIPNHMLAADPAMRGLINRDLALAIAEARDAAIYSTILAASPASVGAGTDLAADILNAAEDMLSTDGYDGRQVIISPADFIAFSLLRGDEQKFARTDPMTPFRFIVAPTVVGNPVLVASEAGRRNEGSASLATFEENDGSTNTTLMRLEQSFLFAIERPGALRFIGAGS